MINRQNIISLAIGFTIIIGFGYFSLFFSSFLSVFILIAYIGYHRFNINEEFRFLSQTALKAVFIASIIAFAVFSYKSYGPRDWDFTCFFLYGNVASKGMNFYNPNDYYSILRTIQIPIEINAGFFREVIDVGCPYPPPTLFLFSILGFFSYNNALIVWTIINSLFLLGSIVLIRDIFFKKDGYESIMISTILVLTFHSSLTTVFYTQILFILLFFLLLFYKYKSAPWSGVFLAIAIFLKPFAIVLFLYLIIKRNNKAITYFIISCLAICLITILNYGFQPFIEYIFHNPNQRAPESLFTESNNQSLLGELYRGLPDNISLAKSIYYVVSIAVVAISGLLVYRKRLNVELHDINFVVLLSVMLLIYPSGQYNYPIVHLISIFILLNYVQKLDNSAFLIFLFYLVSYAGLFYLNIFLLIVSVVLLYRNRMDFIFSSIRYSIKNGT